MGHGFIINRLSPSIICFYAFYTFSFAFASIGDLSPQFRECISACTKIHNCPPKHGYFGWWSREECFSCRQKCMWATVDHFKNRGRPIPQFNGKWPFVPFRIHLGNIFVPIQEPASMLFSMLNAFTVWRMLKRIRLEIRPDWYCLPIWVQFGQVGMATWFASAIFHCCDHWITEMADYCAAFGLILFTLYASLCFVLPQWNLPAIGQFGHFNHQNLRLIGFGLLFFYFRYLHSMYMASYFDYGFHIRCCVQIALFTGALFVCWTIFEYKARRARPSMLFLGAAFGIGWFSALFDALFDFSPFLWLIDAHSLFHLFSIPVPLLWAEFLCQEARLDTKRG